MLLYIVATNRVVSVTMVVERKEEGKAQSVQRPVYYVSEVLTESKERYPHYQKLVYGVYMAARKLRHYFQEHEITVVSSAPVGEIIRNREATGRVAKWAIEMAAHSIKYEPRKAIKSQALVDFINDWTEMQEMTRKPDSLYWKMYFDGSKLIDGSGLEWSSCHLKVINFNMCYRYTSRRLIMLPSMRLYFTVYGWPRRWVLIGLSAMAILI